MNLQRTSVFLAILALTAVADANASISLPTSSTSGSGRCPARTSPSASSISTSSSQTSVTPSNVSQSSNSASSTTTGSSQSLTSVIPSISTPQIPTSLTSLTSLTTMTTVPSSSSSTADVLPTTSSPSASTTIVTPTVSTSTAVPVPSCISPNSFYLQYFTGGNSPSGQYMSVAESGDMTSYSVQPVVDMSAASQFTLDSNNYLVYQADQNYYFSVLDESPAAVYFQLQSTIDKTRLAREPTCSMVFDDTTFAENLSCQTNSGDTFEYCPGLSPSTQFGTGSDSGCQDIQLQVLLCSSSDE